MNWFDYIVSAYLLLGSFAAISLIGKPRPPISPTLAIFSMLITLSIIVGLALT